VTEAAEDNCGHAGTDPEDYPGASPESNLHTVLGQLWLEWYLRHENLAGIYGSS
jgi:hypothetical protein